jgi:glycosyltransferase involved in cell wall biosynthesis
MLIAQKNGYENYVTSLLLSLAELEELHDLEVILYFNAGNPLADPALVGEFLPQFDRFSCRVYRFRHLFGRVLPLMAWVDRLDVLHLPVYLWSRWYPCPVIVTVHDTCGARLSAQGIPSGLEAHVGLIEDQLSLASACLTVSESTKRDLMRFYGVPADQISVVHHGTDPFFRPSPGEAREVKVKYGLDRYVLCVNALQTHKNHSRLLTAFARLQEERDFPHELVLVGRDGLGAEHIHALLADDDLSESVRHLGYVPRDDLRGLYSGADLVVNSSLCEGFGLPLLEAMACDAVVAASDATSFPEVGGDALLYFDPLSVESIGEALWRGLSDRELRRALVERSQIRVKTFSWESAARSTLEAYRAWCGEL